MGSEKKIIFYVVKFEKIHELPGSPLPSSPSTVGFALEQLTEGLISNPQTNPRNFPYTLKWCSYEPDINKYTIFLIRGVCIMCFYILHLLQRLNPKNTNLTYVLRLYLHSFSENINNIDLLKLFFSYISALLFHDKLQQVVR